jgi:Flp pilus assembly secretin CpaC
VIYLTNTNKYVQAQIKEVIDDLRVNLKTTTAEVIEKRISTTKDVLESLRAAKLESLGEREVTNEQLEKLKPKIEKYQSDWYGKQYVKRVNSAKVFRTLLDIETDFANKQ